jgi:hypothetical protein
MINIVRGKTETVPSLFRAIFSERNFVPNPPWMRVASRPKAASAPLMRKPTPEEKELLFRLVGKLTK